MSKHPGGAPRKGREVRERISVRLEPSVIRDAERYADSLSAAIDTALTEWLARKKSAQNASR